MNRGRVKTSAVRLSASRGTVLMFAVVLWGFPLQGNAQTNVVYASQIPGVVLDANLNGSPTQACTDNTAKLNAVLATATALHPIDLIMDGATCIDNIVPAVSRGPLDQTCINLIGLSNVTIEGQGAGAGFFLKSQANCAAIQNIALWGYPPAGARTMSNYVFKSFRVAGNSDQVCTGGVCTAIKVFDADNVVLDNITITDIKYFATGFGNVSNVTISNSTILQPPTTGTDPLHFTGPADHIVIKNNRLQSHDDCVALNAPEAYGGNISYVTITGTQMVGAGCSDFMRIYNYSGGYGGSAFWSTDHIVVDGLFGVANCAANPSVFYFGEAGHSGSAKLNNLHASHIDVDGGGNCELAWFAGTWGEAYISDWVLRNPKPNTPAILVTGTIDSGTFKNGVVMRNSSAQATAYPFQVTNYSTTGTNLTISNITAVDAPGSSFNAAPQLLDKWGIYFTQVTPTGCGRGCR